MKGRQEQEGFTLIELVIVLAIAALVLAVILLAVGGVQRSQRDNETKHAAAKVAAALQSFAGDNNGSMPKFGHNLPPGYLVNIYDGNGKPPQRGPNANTNHDIRYEGQAVCAPAGSNPAIVPGSAYQYAVDYWLEAAANDVCIDNSQ